MLTFCPIGLYLKLLIEREFNYVQLYKFIVLKLGRYTKLIDFIKSSLTHLL